MKLSIEDLVNLMVADTKRKKEKEIMELKMQYGTKWNEEYRRREVDRQQQESERHDR